MSKSNKRHRCNVKMRAIVESLESYGVSSSADAFAPGEAMSGVVSDLGFRLSESEAALLDIAPGHLSEARMARMIAQNVVRTVEVAWSPNLVRVRLSEAARGCERLYGRLGPRGAKGFWPSVQVEWADLVAMAAEEGALAEFYRERNSNAGSEREITRIEEAIHWPLRYLGDPEHDETRRALSLWLTCEALRGLSFSDQFKELGCGRATAYRRRDAAVEIILLGLIRDRVTP